MLVEFTRTQTVKLEGHITITFHEGTRADLPDDVAKQGIIEGWCKCVAVSPGPDEIAVAAPSETKRKRGS